MKKYACNIEFKSGGYSYIEVWAKDEADLTAKTQWFVKRFVRISVMKNQGNPPNRIPQ